MSSFLTTILIVLLSSISLITASIIEGNYNNNNNKHDFLNAPKKYAGANNNNDIPSTGEDWISLTPSWEFQPAASTLSQEEETAEAHRLLVKHTGSYSGYENQFIDGSGTYYNDYSQAWRLLGFYTDCNAPHNNDNECDGGGGGGSNDNDQPACQRFLLWAAYIDLDYSGGGIGEYQFYDRNSQQWDSTSCRSENGRCAKMDCHLKHTNWKLLGFFKEPNYHEWMEQLFKHQGVCLWTNDEYNIMQTDRYLWPCDCTNTNIIDEDGNTLYYDTKPMPEGRIGLGLYIDSRCKYDYTGTEHDILDVLQGYDAYELQANLESWNDAFDVFKICQPCKAYNLGYNPDLQGSGDNNNRNRNSNDDDDAYGFDCYDDADYVNVNQCMKFRTKTEMISGDFRDIMLAHQQGNIVEFALGDVVYGFGGFRTGQMESKFTMSGQLEIPTSVEVFFVGSIVFCLVSMFIYYKTYKRMSHNPKETSLLTISAASPFVSPHAIRRKRTIQIDDTNASFFRQLE